MKPCPICKSTEKAQKVIYMGLPLYLCDCDNVVYGFWSWLFSWLPFNGVFFVYKGRYRRALWHWVNDWEPEEE